MIPVDELVSDIEEEEMLDDLCIIALLHAIQIKRSRSRRLPFHMSPLLGKAYVDDLIHGQEERFYCELCMPKDTFKNYMMDCNNTMAGVVEIVMSFRALKASLMA